MVLINKQLISYYVTNFVRSYTLVNAWSRLIPEAILVLALVVVRLVTTRELGVSYFFLTFLTKLSKSNI